MWNEAFPRSPGETDSAFNHRCIQTLARMYQRNGFNNCASVYTSRVMGRVVRPVQRDPGDRLMLPPDPPPLAEDGRTPPSSQTRVPPGYGEDQGPPGPGAGPGPGDVPYTPTRAGPSRPPVMPDTPRRGAGKTPQITTPGAGSARQQMEQRQQRQAYVEENDNIFDELYDVTPLQSPGGGAPPQG
jgi:hypothetical protein